VNVPFFVLIATALSCGDDDVGLAGPSDTGVMRDTPEILNGCPALRAPIIEDLEGDTWSSWASPMFFDRYCIRCHGTTVMDEMRNGAPPGYNWDDETMVLMGMCGTTRTCLEAIRHAAGVANYMPFNPQPGDPVPTCEERRRLVRWIDGGAPP
jgi:hypothetical protein